MAFICQMCGASSAERGECDTCAVPLTPAGMIGGAVDALAEPPDPPLSTKLFIGSMMAALVATFILGGMFDDAWVAMYALGFTLIIFSAYGQRLARKAKKRAADRLHRAALDERPTVDIGAIEPGIVRVRGRVRLHGSDADSLFLAGACTSPFTIVDDTGELFVNAGMVMAAWELGTKPNALIREGDLVDVVGFVSHGAPRPGRGFRDVETRLEMHGRAGVPFYVRPLEEETAGPRVRVGVDEGDENAVEQRGAAPRRQKEKSVR